MPITAIPGTPLYEEMARRQMVNAQSGQPAVQNSNYGTSPITEPNYQNFRKLEQGTGTNYGFIDDMLARDPAMAKAYDPSRSSSSSASSSSASSPGAYDPSALMKSIHSSYDQSRLAHLGTGKAYEKRNADLMANRMGGANTGITNLLNAQSRKETDALLAGNERDRAMAIAQAQRDAEEMRMRHQETLSRDRLTAAAQTAAQRAANTAAYNQPSQRLPGGSSSGASTQSSSVGATFSGGRDPGSRIPGSRPGGGGGGGGGGGMPPTPPPGTPPPPPTDEDPYGHKEGPGESYQDQQNRLNAPPKGQAYDPMQDFAAFQKWMEDQTRDWEYNQNQLMNNPQSQSPYSTMKNQPNTMGSAYDPRLAGILSRGGGGGATTSGGGYVA